MRKIIVLAAVVMLLSFSCSPHFHLDFLGQEKMQEVVLIDSPAKEKVLIIDISGFLSSTFDPGILGREGDVLSRVFSRLQRASSDDLVKGVIIRLDTPGGEVTASDILFHEILRYKKRSGRPVIALMMGIAASGGYYVASACDHIIAHPSTITGSIGVISIFPNVEDLFAKIGIKVNVIKSGTMKDSGSSFRDLSDEERSLFQDMVDEFYLKFLEAVLQGRGESLSMEELKEIADGRVYTAQQALEKKLVDEIGYFRNAYDKTLASAGIASAKVIAYTYYPKTTTNIYASTLQPSPLDEDEGLEILARSLKSGFYYLWLPQTLQ